VDLCGPGNQDDPLCLATATFSCVSTGLVGGLFAFTTDTLNGGQSIFTNQSQFIQLNSGVYQLTLSGSFVANQNSTGVIAGGEGIFPFSGSRITWDTLTLPGLDANGVAGVTAILPATQIVEVNFNGGIGMSLAPLVPPNTTIVNPQCTLVITQLE
jgi:hypothetical protein